MSTLPPNVSPAEIPALPAPSGQVATVHSPWTSIQSVEMGALIVMMIIPTLLVALRIYIKAVLVKQWTLADWTTCVAWIGMVAELTFEFILIEYGNGLHGWQVSLEKFSDFARIINLEQIVYMPAIFFAKAACLLQLAEIFVTTKYSARWWLIYGLIAANAVFFTILLFIEIFECTPREKIWNPTLPGTCVNIQQTFIATGTINVVDDLLILLLPTIWVWRLHVAKSRKIGVTAVFATAAFAFTCSIMRLVMSIESVTSSDITYALMPVSLWATAEVAAAVAVVCLPVMPRLARHTVLLSKIRNSYASRKISSLWSRSTSSGVRSGIDVSSSKKEWFSENISSVDSDTPNDSNRLSLPELRLSGDVEQAGIQRTVEVSTTSEYHALG